jgi:hypothetical protein
MLYPTYKYERNEFVFRWKHNKLGIRRAHHSKNPLKPLLGVFELMSVVRNLHTPEDGSVQG